MATSAYYLSITIIKPLFKNSFRNSWTNSSKISGLSLKHLEDKV